MSDGYSARRGVQVADTPSALGRTRLSRRHWQDIRRACQLGADGGLYSVELHGVKLIYRSQRACWGPAQDKAKPSAAQDRQATGGSKAAAQHPPTTPPRTLDAQRPRRGRKVQGSTRPHSCCSHTAADENAGSASRAAAGGTAGASSTVAQSPSVNSPRRLNSRQRRSANRLVEYIRSKQASQSAAAEPPRIKTPERASPKRSHEDGVRGSGDVEEAAATSRRRIVDVDYEARKEAAAALYTAWRQHTLTTTTNTSPKRALDHGAQEGSGRRGGGQRRLADPGLSATRIRYVDDDED